MVFACIVIENGLSFTIAVTATTTAATTAAAGISADNCLYQKLFCYCTTTAFHNCSYQETSIWPCQVFIYLLDLNINAQ